MWHLAELQQWKRASERLERGGSLLVDYAAGLTSGHMIPEAEKSEKRAAEAVAAPRRRPCTEHRSRPCLLSAILAPKAALRFRRFDGSSVAETGRSP